MLQLLIRAWEVVLPRLAPEQSAQQTREDLQHETFRLFQIPLPPLRVFKGAGSPCEMRAPWTLKIPRVSCYSWPQEVAISTARLVLCWDSGL